MNFFIKNILTMTPLSLALGLGLGVGLGLASPASQAQNTASTESTTAPQALEIQHPTVDEFVRFMQARHGFEAEALRAQLEQAQVLPSVLKAIRPATQPQQRSWQKYRSRFVHPTRIRQGVAFWNEHAATLQAAQERSGVPASIIVGIIGVETGYGANMGSYRVLDALATLAFHYPPRSAFFTGELEQFLLYARDEKLDPASVRGSYAGAIGIPQFMPSSLRRFAVDFDQDGRINLRGDAEDSIGSVANFLAVHGWSRPGSQDNHLVAWPVQVNEASANHLQAWVDAGILPTLSPETFIEAGLSLPTEARGEDKLTFIDLATPKAATEYWVGNQNFYALTRYNRSSFYAMSVFLLGEAVKQARQRTP